MTTDPTDADGNGSPDVVDAQWPSVFRTLSKLDGFVDGKWDASQGAVVVQWNGTVPASAAAVQDQAAEQGLVLHLQQVQFDEKQLRDAAGDLFSALSDADIAVSSVGIAPGHDALLVSGRDVSGDETVQRQATVVAEGSIGDIPIRFVPFDPSAAGNVPF